MNLVEIREECWQIGGEVGTTDADRFWPIATMNRYINRVYRNIARETKCIRDAITPAICMITCPIIDYTTLTAGSFDYYWANTPGMPIYHLNVSQFAHPLDPRILEIDEVKIGVYRLIKVKSQKWRRNPYWEQLVSAPTEFATDVSNNTLVMNARMTEPAVMQLSVRRMPLIALSADADIPEIRESYHDFFKNGVLAEMYGKHDSEVFDKTKSSDYFGLFQRDIDEIKQQESILDRAGVSVVEVQSAFI